MKTTIRDLPVELLHKIVQWLYYDLDPVVVYNFYRMDRYHSIKLQGICKTGYIDAISENIKNAKIIASLPYAVKVKHDDWTVKPTVHTTYVKYVERSQEEKLLTLKIYLIDSWRSKDGRKLVKIEDDRWRPTVMTCTLIRSLVDKELCNLVKVKDLVIWKEGWEGLMEIFNLWKYLKYI